MIGSLENIFSMLPPPCAAGARWLVNAAGSKGMERFFVFTAWLGAVVESAVWYAVNTAGRTIVRGMRGATDRPRRARADHPQDSDVPQPAWAASVVR